VCARACAVDVDRDRVVYFGDAYGSPLGGLLYDVSSNTLSVIEFSGAEAEEITRERYHFAWYEAKLGVFLLKTTVSGKVYSIDPTSFRVEQVATMGGDAVPDAMNGVQT